jgi:hypothetical protein
MPPSNFSYKTPNAAPMQECPFAMQEAVDVVIAAAASQQACSMAMLMCTG